MNTIPTPKEPALVQIAQWIFDPVRYMSKNFQKYGDLFQAYVSWGSSDPLLMVSEPKAMQYMLTHDTTKQLTAPGDVNSILEPLIGRQNLILLSGKEHRRRRQLVMPPFHGERLQAYGEIIQQITQQVIAEWSTEEPVNVRNAMQKMTMRVILQAVFGLYEGERYNRLETLLSQRLNMTGSPLGAVLLFLPWLRKDFGAWSPGGRIRQIAEETDRLLFEEIRERRANPDPNRVDILSLLLMAEDEAGHGLTDQDLRDELMTLLTAGHETTATALTWAMYWIHSLPEVKEKLLAELDQVSNPNDPSSFLKLSYLNAVCNETLRIHPVAMLTFPRRVEEPIELCGYQLEPGILIMGSIYLLHQREDLYPEPQQFRPERFLERQFSPYEFMPFGGGVRRCVGAALAQYEMKIILGTILSTLDLELLNQKPVAPTRRGITLGQNAQIWIQKIGQHSPQMAVPS
ncbi:cytochrome P450 [Halothece sp. PCC 7418]|uniref:cytochrome P450 n=1 Tax=Halothece sp. (strain PCC 7418) TaxID=65093 RepID=UPI0002A05DAA|nr:cytochrome P450 [Halothece sp. PCC 7418]AFZ45049.1 cytochrome P450 [Halothece sp. PCC 7418]